MNSTLPSNKFDAIFSLLQSPLFAEFELSQEAPSVFRAVGRTHTETWHSALFGWLLNPTSSHGLNSFPLMRLLLLLKAQPQAAPHGIDMDRLVAQGIFTDAKAQPNEGAVLEVSVPSVGRFDVFVDGISLTDPNNLHSVPNKPQSVKLLIEMKVKAKIDPQQCLKYINYIAAEKANNNFIIPVFVAPARQLRGNPVNIFGSDQWVALTYQEIYDEVIEPCLQHPRLSEFGRYTLREYVKTLKWREPGEEPLATTQRDIEIVEALLTNHGIAIRALYDMLADRHKGFMPSPTSSKNNIVVKIKEKSSATVLTTINAASVADLYRKSLEFLDKNNYLGQLQIPIGSGSKRYLLATQSVDQQGNEMLNPAHYTDGRGNDYYMEANMSRDGGIRNLEKLLDPLGLVTE